MAGSLNIFKYPPRFQFGQPGPCGGSSCCTDTCIQMIVEYYTNVKRSLYDIRYWAQAKTAFDERACTGINHIEAMNALTHYGLGHYRVSFGATSHTVWDKVAIGPVIVGVWYGSYPNWRWSTKTNRAEYGGRNDYGFSGAHAVLAIGRRKHTYNVNDHRDLYMRDPDHNSAARPQKPEYDIIKRTQLEKAMQNLPKYSPFKQTYIIYPTKKKTV